MVNFSYIFIHKRNLKAHQQPTDGRRPRRGHKLIPNLGKKIKDLLLLINKNHIILINIGLVLLKIFLIYLSSNFMSR